MLDSFHLGGWGMYPTTIAGLVLVIAAARYAWSPDRRRLQIVRSLAWLTILSSCLGFVTGVIRSFTAASTGDAHHMAAYVIAGVGESLSNIGLGLVMLAVAALATTLGASRRDQLAERY